jgi:hypothetical protein
MLGHVLPKLGSRPIIEITAPEILAELRPLEEQGMHETGTRTKQRLSQLFRYAIATGRASATRPRTSAVPSQPCR